MPFASEIGRWDPRFNSEIPAMHMHLLPNGKVLYWYLPAAPAPGVVGIRLWTPNTSPPVITTVDPPTDPPGNNIFCSGHSAFPSGDILVAGGGGSEADAKLHALQYNQSGPPWTKLTDMGTAEQQKRWYPTCTTLHNGEVLVTSGNYMDKLHFNQISQVWSPVANDWVNLAIPDPAFDYFYPWIHVTPLADASKRVFLFGPRFTCLYLNPAGSGSWSSAPSRTSPDRDYGTGVMYLPDKAIVIGGRTGAVPLATAEFIDLTSPSPGWASAGSMAKPRRHHNAVLLANGHIVVCGGTEKLDFDDETGAVQEAERWIPPTAQYPEGRWDLMASWVEPGTTSYRGYHSTAILLPDARVVTGGGNNLVGSDTMQIFNPPYLFVPNSDTLAERPVITSAPPTVNYNATFNVQIQPTPVHTIARATLVRPSSVTHSVNMDQRFVELEIVSLSGNNVQLRAPADGTFAPPGFYMLFLLNNVGIGVPSEARFIQLQ